MIRDEIIDEVVESCRAKFHSFSGGVVSNHPSPVMRLLKDEPPAFGAGVDIREVVNHVLFAYNKARYVPVKKGDKPSQ